MEKKGRNQRTIRDIFLIDPIRVVDYASEDADITFRLKKVFEEDLNNNNLTHLAESIEFPLIQVLANIERAGVSINSKYLNVFSVELAELIQSTESDIIRLAGLDFNVGSPKQLGEILFTRLKLNDKAKKTKSGQFSTNEETLESSGVLITS